MTAPKLRDIARSVCEEYGVSNDMLVMQNRIHLLVLARAAFIRRAAKYYRVSAIARFLQRDHSTITYYLRRRRDPVRDLKR